MAHLVKSFNFSVNDFIRSTNQFYSILGKYKMGINIFSIITNYIFSIIMLISNYPMGWFFLFCGTFLTIYLINVRYFKLRRIYKNDPNLNEQVKIEINDEGYKSSVSDAYSFYQWSYFERVFETNDYYFLFFHKYNTFIIPKLILSENEVIIFKDILKDNNLQVMFWGNS